MGSDTMLYQEIHQQPDVLEKFAQIEQGPVKKSCGPHTGRRHSTGRHSGKGDK